MSERTFRFIVLTGEPGCGKTTLIKKTCDILKRKNFTLSGFLTEEVRWGRERIGFDVVLLSGKRSPLARLNDSGNRKEAFVGKYAVQVKSFESSVLPILNFEEKNSVLVLDEIGKMELLSGKFKDFVGKCLTERKGVILATVPLSSHLGLVEKIKSHPETCLITVDRENRDVLLDRITTLVVDAKRKYNEE